MGKLSKLTHLRSTFRERARSFITNQVALNVFCPTGKGGGVDATCSPGKGNPNSEAFGTKDPYIYHVTSVSPEKFKSGLKPSTTGESGPGVYLATEPAKGMYHVSGAEVKTTIRVSKDALIKAYGLYPKTKSGLQFDDFTGEIHLPGKRVIEAKFLEFKTPEGWSSVLAPASQPVKKQSVKAPNPPSITFSKGKSGDYLRKLLATNAAQKKSPNPLAIDPTRTTTIQRSFEEQIKKRYAKFQKALVDYLLSGEVVTNAFCPTGTGGGVKATCSPKARKPWTKGTPLNKIKLKGGYSLKMEQSPEYEGGISYRYFKDGKSVGHLDLKTRKDHGVSVIDHGLDAEHRGKRLGVEAIQKLSRYYGRIHSMDLSHSSEAAKKMWKNAGAKERKTAAGSVLEIDLTTNVFCPTGEGGGVDPTCGKKGKKTVKKKAKVVWFSQDDEEMDYDLADEALQVAKRSGINILSDKELTAATVEKGRVTAALFTGLSGDVYSFDVAVDPNHQGKGLGSQLTDLGLQNFGNYSEMGASIKLDAVNPQMVEMLKRRGFSVTGQFGAHQIMERASDEPTANAAFKFETSEAKVNNFEQWIISKLTETMEDKDVYSGQDWWKLYIERAFKQGADRAFESMKKKGKADQRSSDRMSGAKNQFFSTFGTEATKERMKLIAGRTFKGMKGLNDMMKTQLTLALIDGLLQGQSPRVIAKALVDKVGVNKTRALTIARTEIVRAHAEGTIASLKALGVKQIGVQVEVAVSGNACPICQKYKGKIFDIDKAQGLIPFHPGCRCTVIPHVTDDTSPQKERQRKNIERSIKSTTR